MVRIIYSVGCGFSSGEWWDTLQFNWTACNELTHFIRTLARFKCKNVTTHYHYVPMYTQCTSRVSSWRNEVCIVQRKQYAYKAIAQIVYAFSHSTHMVCIVLYRIPLCIWECSIGLPFSLFCLFFVVLALNFCTVCSMLVYTVYYTYSYVAFCYFTLYSFNAPFHGQTIVAIIFYRHRAYIFISFSFSTWRVEEVIFYFTILFHIQIFHHSRIRVAYNILLNLFFIKN